MSLRRNNALDNAPKRGKNGVEAATMGHRVAGTRRRLADNGVVRLLQEGIEFGV